MKRRSECSGRRSRSQRGVFLVLLCIVLTAISSVILLLWLDSFNVAYSNSAIQTHLELVCRRAALSAVQQKQAALAFQQGIDDMMTGSAAGKSGYPPRETEVLEATIVVPTMPEDGTFSFPTRFPDPFSDTTVHQTPLSDTGWCAGAGSGKCFFYGDITATGPLSDPNVDHITPSSLVSNRANAGNSASCRIRARIRNNFGTKNLTATINAYVPTFADRTESTYLDPSNPVVVNQAPYPGLTVAVATEMPVSIDPAQYRYLFEENLAPSYASGFTSLYTPLVSISRAAIVRGGASGFSAPSTGDVYNGSASVTAGLSPAAYTDGQMQLLANCINPATMLRNAFLSTVMELASRHGEFRNMTELLHVNPMHMDGSDPANFANSPTTMVALGNDVVQQSYQLPFVEYADTLSGFADNWIVPFDQSGALSHTATDVEKLVANQLRSCYHLYTGGSDGVQRFQLPDITNGANAGFEPSVYDYQPQLYGLSSYMTGRPWAQQCPWGTGGGCMMNLSRSLTAAELVSALGSTQRCPIAASGLGYGCDSMPAQDLSPDYWGLAKYLNGSNSAFLSPGSFKFDSSAVATPPQPFTGGVSYGTRANNTSAVLIVTHRPPPTDAASQQIRDAMRTISGGSDPACECDVLSSSCTFDDWIAAAHHGRRPLTVVFIPTSAADFTAQGLLRLQNAFCIPPRSAGLESHQELNKLLLMAPQFSAVAANENAAFSTYWNAMLTDPSKIVTIARGLFMFRINNPGNRF